MHNRFESRLKRILNEYEKINPQKFCTIMVDERGAENNSIEIDGKEFLLAKDKNPMDFIREYEVKNNLTFNNSNSLVVRIKDYGRKSSYR